MSAQPYEPLRLVPPATQNHIQMAWLLRAREAARRAFDAALAVPRKAAGFIGRVLHKLHLHKAASALRRLASKLVRPVAATASRLGTSGLVAAATSVVTSPTGRAVLTGVGRVLGRIGGWAARKAYSGLDRALRFFGKAGNTAADNLFAAVVSVGGKIGSVAAPVVHRVARLTDPASTPVRLLSGLCQSYVVHKLLRGFITNPWLRVLTEVVLIPAVLDSRLWDSIRRTCRQAQVRAQQLREQAQVLVDLEEQQPADHQEPLFDDDVLVPSNRAERRAAQRQNRHQQH